ncbi:MAG: hypothetical protein IH947_04930 [Bacteroidetes bacterium]|nr:hypothetical protein [Bacteroidota bacterium]
MKNKKTILYLTAVEDAVNKAVIRSQVLRLLAQFQKNSDENFLMLSFIPFRFYFNIKSPFKSFLAYKKKRKEIKKEYQTSQVSIVFFPFLFPFRRKYFHMRTFHLVAFLCQTFPLLLFFLIKENVVFIHARSYPACLISYLCGKLLNIKYLFDMRGFYPDEGVIYGSYTHNSNNYLRWKNIEKTLIKNAYCVFIESEPFKQYVENIFPHPNIALIPCYVDDAIFEFNQKRKDELRKEFNLNDKFVVVYSGTIGGWHDTTVQSDYFLKIKEQIPNSYFLILTFEQKNNLIHSTLKEKGIAPDDYSLLNPESFEVSKYLNMGDVGLLTIANLPTAKKAISVKFGEYLACGLPVACTPFVEGAAQLILKYKCGVVLDLQLQDSFEQMHHLIKNYTKIQNNGFKVVRDYLSVKKTAPKFLKIYQSAVNN